MCQIVTTQRKKKKTRLHSFSMVELLVIMAIIGILTAITLQAISALTAAAARNRARAEIKGMEASLEGYKTDNGGYPVATTMTTNQYSNFDGSGVTTPYIAASQILYQALSGKTNFLDTPVANVRAYGTYKVGQLGNATAAAGTTGSASTYLQDPWYNSYGYSTAELTGATNSTPYNGSGFFDIWSTAGNLTTTPNKAITNTAAWIKNWPD